MQHEKKGHLSIDKAKDRVSVKNIATVKKEQASWGRKLGQDKR